MELTLLSLNTDRPHGNQPLISPCGGDLAAMYKSNRCPSTALLTQDTFWCQIGNTPRPKYINTRPYWAVGRNTVVKRQPFTHSLQSFVTPMYRAEGAHYNGHEPGWLTACHQWTTRSRTIDPSIPNHLPLPCTQFHHENSVSFKFEIF
jgi:hypothetical protein